MTGSNDETSPPHRELKYASLSCTCRQNLLHCGLSYSSSSPFMRSNMSSLPSLACHVCQLAILSTRLSSRAPCTKTSCPSLFAAAKSCNTEFLRFFLVFTVYSVNDIRQGREICTTHASVPSLHTVHPAPVTQGWTEFFFPNLAEVIEGTLRFTVHIS